LTNPHTIRGQEEDKDKEKKQEEEKEIEQEVLYPQIEGNSISDDTIHNNQKLVDVKEIVEFWDNNGFGFRNVNGKQQLWFWFRH
jgi:hypothetical protein